MQEIRSEKNQPEYMSNIDRGRQRHPRNRHHHASEKLSPFTKRIKRGSWVLMAAALIILAVNVALNPSTPVDTSEEAAMVFETHASSSLAIGTRLASVDEYLGGRDYTIIHTSRSDETTIWIWDYAAEDGDYVQVFVDGNALGDPFMIRLKPVTFSVPTVAEVSVVGTRDGGGGITYAVHYGMNETTYFNGMDQGEQNVYTLMRE